MTHEKNLLGFKKGCFLMLDCGNQILDRYESSFKRVQC